MNVAVDPQSLAAALLVIMGSAVGIIEALKHWIPSEAKPAVSILVGAVLGVAYLLIPVEYQAAYLILLSGATGTATVAVAKRIAEGAGSSS